MVSRRTWFRIHQAAGVAGAAFFVLMAITGGVLVFRGEFEPTVPRASPIDSHLPLEQLIERAEAAGDGSVATDVELSRSPEQPYRVWLDDVHETEVFLDGAGTVLALRRGDERLGRVLYQIHTGEIVGKNGRWYAMIASVLLCGLVVTGLAMVVSRRRRQKGNA